jgi:biopolymer transport protein ExbB
MTPRKQELIGRKALGMVYALAASLTLLAAPLAAQQSPDAAPPVVSGEAPATLSTPGSDSAPTLPQADTGSPSVSPSVETPATGAAPVVPSTDSPTTPPAAETPATGTPGTTPPAAGTETAPAPPSPANPHAAGGAAPLSPLSMYHAAHWIVKAVMLSLIFACFVTWTVFLFKTVELAIATRRLRATRRRIDSAESLAAAQGALSGKTDPAAFMVAAAAEELRRSAPALEPAGVKERVASLLTQTEAQAARHLRRGTGLLATIGSTAPFVGLFGTVWGIMNSFIAIAETKTTNLAVVAPGIAEALLATAIGLVAAIPAVIIYNLFSRAIGAYRQGLGDAASGIARLVSRDLDRGLRTEG